MSEPTKIHQSKQGRRPHYVREWAEKFQMSQADIARETGIDKSTISRIFDKRAPSSPQGQTQAKLAALFQTEPESLFRHPDEDWLAQFFAGRKRDEIERIKQMLETGFPKSKTG